MPSTVIAAVRQAMTATAADVSPDPPALLVTYAGEQEAWAGNLRTL